jgi:enoyl-CoA hydratase/carnithine racemase
VIDYEVRDGGVAEILFNNGPVNAITEPFMDALLEALDRARRDERARAVILASAIPGRFCAGLDLPPFSAARRPTPTASWARSTRASAKPELMTEARRHPALFAAKSPELVRLGKAAFLRAAAGGYQEGAEAAVDLVSTVFGTEDCKESLAAFAEKRRPVWRGA